MENRKFELTNITMEYKGRTLYRIRALKDFKEVEAGDLGGWVSNENNLSQEGDCWIYDEAKCMDNARMYHNSAMYNNAVMLDNSKMFENSRMYRDSRLKNKENLYGKLVTKVDRFIEINNTGGRIVTGVLKDGKILYNIGCQNEITKETFIDRIYNEGGGIEKNPHRKEYLKIIDMIELYFSK